MSHSPTITVRRRVLEDYHHPWKTTTILEDYHHLWRLTLFRALTWPSFVAKKQKNNRGGPFHGTRGGPFHGTHSMDGAQARLSPSAPASCSVAAPGPPLAMISQSPGHGSKPRAPSEHPNLHKNRLVYPKKAPLVLKHGHLQVAP